ncbi:MAG: carbamoyltransferase HypF, partial [Chloroflexi bacterium]|nr:carbamoyltransferase HypF [Chloroflexota bacterium]
ALMMADLEIVAGHCFIDEAERSLLVSRQRPVVLLRRRPGSPVAAQVAPGQDILGVMLPYTPLHYLLLADRQPVPVLVMTSGNLSEEPISTDNVEARQRLSGLADAFLMHDREIRTRCDDSVLRVFRQPGGTEGQMGSAYILRRSRGYAPDPLQLPFEAMPLLAAGTELKNTFCLTRDRYAFLSHHIGDMENYETLRSFEDGVAHFERLFRIQPQAIAHDLHPDYLSTRYALQRGERDGLPLYPVQHHHAHIAACMAEHGLGTCEKVIGVAFDGTGYGLDGTIWGGEFLVAEYAGFERAGWLEPFPLPGGDAAVKRPSRTALALLWSLGLEWDSSLPPLRDLCSEERLALRLQLERGLNTPKTSSMGRLFDAAASLAGVRQKVNYEAQAAIEFEAAADPDEESAYRFDLRDGRLDPAPLVAALVEDACCGEPLPKISARFHNAVVEATLQMCNAIRRERGIPLVALSGGVWQNMRILRGVVQRLEADGFQALVPRQAPANDGGVALGQAVVALRLLRQT